MVYKFFSPYLFYRYSSIHSISRKKWLCLLDKYPIIE